MVRSLADRLSSFFWRGANAPSDDDMSRREYCERCSAPLASEALFHQYRVCPACRFHYPVTARERISMIADSGTFRESHRSIVASGSPETRPAATYRRSTGERRRTGLTEAVITGRGDIGGVPVMLITLDFRFSGGTLGVVVGEKVSLALESATRRRMPVVAVITSGGERRQEWVLSLMQMVKTSLAVNGLDRQGLPFIAVMANPTSGQIYSSFANLADIILAEPGAILGLAPYLGHKEDPQVAYSAETHLVHGTIDRIVDREHLRGLLLVLLGMMTPKQSVPARVEKEGGWTAKSHEVTNDRIDDGQLEELWPPAWETVQLAHQSQRPSTMDFIRRSLSNFVELRGPIVGSSCTSNPIPCPVECMKYFP